MRNIRRIFAIFAILFFCSPAFAQRGGRGGGGRGAGAPNEGRGQAGPSLKIERDLEYARAGGQPLTLDLYHLEPLPAPRPVIVWIHGSEPGASKIASPATALISPSGVAVASIEYRAGTGVTLQMQLADAKAAVRWLRANAKKYNLDPSHIGAFGYGVGGQLAALLGTTADATALEGDEGNPGESSQVQAVIDVAGPMTTGSLNPVDYVTKDDAPTLIIHGTADTEVSTRQSQMLVSALKVAGVDTLLDMQVGAPHDLGQLLSPVAMQSVSSFVAQHLLGARISPALSAFVSTPGDSFIDPVALDLGGTLYKLYATPSRGPKTYASYRIYLPPGYSTNGTRRYPVIYFLHGRSVDSKRPITAGYIARIDAEIRSGVMPPAIVVLVQGLNTGWYVDAQDGQHPMESVLVKDLIAHIDATYRTIATREGRAIEGHSMGGYGALHIGFKYPDLFAAVTGNSPALIENVADGVGDQTFWASQMPLTLAAKNADKVRRQSIRVICGTADNLFAGAKSLHDELIKLNVPHEFLPVPESPHNHDQLLQYEKFDTMEFYGKVFGGTKSTKK
jgi:acetyl esterase/lipase/enterochelin esterase-like enzyme